MKRPVQTLAAVLGAQLLLAAVLFGARAGGRAPDAPLLAFDPAAVDRLIVEGPGEARVELTRSDGAWRVATRAGFPADSGKVRRALERLSALRRGAPVATSPEAAARFRVADGAFERRVTLEAAGKPVGAVLFGGAAALRSVHARVAGGSEVQLVEFSTWELPAAADEWIDRGVLRIPVDEIEAIVAGGVTLERSAGGGADGSAPKTWRAAGLPPGASLDPAAADALARAVADLTISGVAEAPPSPSPEAWVLAVRRSGGEGVEHRFQRPASGGDWLLRTTARSEVLRVAPYTAEALQRAASPATLSARPAAAAAGKSGPPAGAKR